MIPDEAVEALASALAMEALIEADMGGYGWNVETDSPDHFMPRARERAATYLEAAAPHLMAAAWDEGYRECYERQMYEPVPVNPYRKDAA